MRDRKIGRRIVAVLIALCLILTEGHLSEIGKVFEGTSSGMKAVAAGANWGTDYLYYFAKIGGTYYRLSRGSITTAKTVGQYLEENNITITGHTYAIPTNEYEILETFDFSSFVINLNGKKYVCGFEALKANPQGYDGYYTYTADVVNAVKNKIGGTSGMWGLYGGEEQYSVPNTTDSFHQDFIVTLYDCFEQPLFGFLDIGTEENYYRLHKQTILAKDVTKVSMGHILNPETFTYACIPETYDFSHFENNTKYNVTRDGITYVYRPDDYVPTVEEVVNGTFQPYYTIAEIGVSAETRMHKHEEWYGADEGWLDGTAEEWNAPQDTTAYHWNFRATLHSYPMVRIVANSGSAVYDGTEQSLTGYKVYLGDDETGELEVQFKKVSASGSGTARGEYDVTVTGTKVGATVETQDGQKFTVKAIETGTLTVGNPTVTVTVTDATKEYGDADPATFGWTASGLMDGDDESILTVTVSREEGEDAGDYVLTPSGDAVQNGYNVVYETGTFTITKATVTVKPDNKTKSFGDPDPILTASVSGLKNNDAASVISYTLSRVVGENVGSYAITASGAAVQGNYNVTFAEGTFEIVPQGNIVVVAITGKNGTLTYNGSAQKFSGYEVVSISSPLYKEEDIVYSGAAEASGTDVGKYDMGLDESMFSNTNPNFTNVRFDVVDGSLTIKAAEITVTADDASKTYGAGDPELTATVTGLQGNDSADDIQYDVTREDGSNVGTYTITPSGDEVQGNYIVKYATGTFTINPRGGITVTITGHTGTETYDGQEHSVSGYDIAISDRIYSVDYVAFNGTDSVSAKDSGVWPMRLSATDFENTNGNFTDVNFVINDGALTILQAKATVTADEATKVYGEDDPELTATVTGVIEGDDISLIVYTLARKEGNEVGEYTITPSGEKSQGNYDVQFETGVFTIEHATLTVKADDLTKEYGDADPEYTATLTGLQYDDTEESIDFRYNIGREEGENAGSYELQVFGAEVLQNYIVVYESGEFTITPATVTITADAKSKVYGEDDPELTATVTGLKNGDTESALKYSISRAEGENVGEYAITPSGEETQGNYVVEYTADNLTIAPLTGVTVTITGKSSTVIYDGTEHSVEGYSVSISDPLYTVDDFAFSGTAAVTASDAGTTAMGLTPQQFTNTNDNFADVTFVVTDGTLTIVRGSVTVTVDAKTKVYGDNDPGYTVTITGLADGDTESSINYSIARETGENVGAYKITASGDAAQGNYDVTFVSALLTITKATVTISAVDTKKEYAEEDPELMVEFEGLVAGDGPDAIVYEIEREAGENVGVYTILVTAETDQGNYNVLTKNAAFTIGSYDGIIVSIGGHSDILTYDGKEHVVTGYDVASSDPLFTADDIAFSGTAEMKAVNAGETAMGLSENDFTNTNPNFSDVKFIVSDGLLIINRAGATVTATAAEKTYGESDPEFTATTDGLFGDDTVSYTLSREAGEDAGTYKVTPEGEEIQGNYVVYYVAGEFKINPRSITVTADDLSKVYGDEDPELTVTIEGMAGEVTTTLEEVAKAIRSLASAGIADLMLLIPGTMRPFGFRSASVKNYKATDGKDTIRYSVERTGGEDVGTYSVTVSGDQIQGNYQVEFVSGTFTVERREVTVTAENLTKTYGDSDPELTVKVDGLVGDDKLEYTVKREAGENVGTYKVTVSGPATQGNYNVTFVEGTFAVNSSSDMTLIDVTPKTVVYDGSGHGPIIEASVTDGTVVEYSTDGGKTWMTQAPVMSNVGTYDVLVRATNDNFTTAQISATVTIEPKEVTVKVTDEKKYVGDEDPKWTVEVDGVIAPETLTFTVERVEGETAGEYAVTVSGEELQGNYKVTYVAGKLTIVEEENEDPEIPSPKTDDMRMYVFLMALILSAITAYAAARKRREEAAE